MNNEKKIAFILKLIQSDKFHGGGEKLFYKLIQGFIKDGYDIDIYCAKSDVSSIEGVNKITVIDEPYNHLDPFSMEKFYANVKELTDKHNYNYIISENITPPVDITFMQGHSMVHRQKSVKSPIEALFYPFRSVKRTRIKYQQKWIEQGYRKAFVPSNIVKNELINNFKINRDTIEVVYPGVDMPENIEDKIENEYYTFGLSAPGFEKKGGYIFLKALFELKKKNNQFKAKIIYPKHKKNLFLKLFIKMLGLENYVEFIGFQSSMQNFYKSTDCIVMPSKEDSFGLLALEGMSYGKVCIVSSLAGASEIVEEGINGFVFDNSKHNHKKLAGKMLYVIENKENNKNITQKAIETAKQYSWQNTYEKFKSKLPAIKF